MRTMPLNTPLLRRRVPRRVQRYPVRWAVLEINDQPASDSWLVDISSLGARLETTFALGPKLPVRFTVLLPDGETKLELAGQIVWMRPIFMREGCFHQGLKFYSTNWELDRLGRNSQK